MLSKDWGEIAIRFSQSSTPLTFPAAHSPSKNPEVYLKYTCRMRNGCVGKKGLNFGSERRHQVPVLGAGSSLALKPTYMVDFREFRDMGALFLRLSGLVNVPRDLKFAPKYPPFLSTTTLCF